MGPHTGPFPLPVSDGYSGAMGLHASQSALKAAQYTGDPMTAKIVVGKYFGEHLPGDDVSKDARAWKTLRELTRLGFVRFDPPVDYRTIPADGLTVAVDPLADLRALRGNSSRKAFTEALAKAGVVVDETFPMSELKAYVASLIEEADKK